MYESHVGYCKFCGGKVYWYWDPRGFWAPPFEAWILGVVPRGEWIHHYHCCR